MQRRRRRDRLGPYRGRARQPTVLDQVAVPDPQEPGEPAQGRRVHAGQFHYAFTNTLTEEQSAKVYERYHIPAPGNWVWAYGLIANFKPGHQETWVNYKNDSRAPLLFIAGGADNIMPPSVNRSNAKHYTSNTITDYEEFPGRSHWTCGEPGWKAVADRALEWAVEHATEKEVVGSVRLSDFRSKVRAAGQRAAALRGSRPRRAAAGHRSPRRGARRSARRRSVCPSRPDPVDQGGDRRRSQPGSGSRSGMSERPPRST